MPRLFGKTRNNLVLILDSPYQMPGNSMRLHVSNIIMLFMFIMSMIQMVFISARLECGRS
jgi:hypothetical protein